MGTFGIKDNYECFVIGYLLLLVIVMITDSLIEISGQVVNKLIHDGLFLTHIFPYVRIINY